MIVHHVDEAYFEWLYDIACDGRYGGNISFRKLISYLHKREFEWTIDGDYSRYKDGIDLRHRYAYSELGNSALAKEIEGRCSVLEMMIALAIKTENFMDDVEYGDRTGQWLWGMINTLGLGYMHDDEFDEKEADKIINRFLDREYSRDGRGGLFKVPNSDEDPRRMSIWDQMCAYTRNMV